MKDRRQRLNPQEKTLLHRLQTLVAWLAFMCMLAWWGWSQLKRRFT